MLDILSPQQFDGWLAFNELERVGGYWHAASLINSLLAVAAGLAGRQLRPKDLARPEDFMPPEDRRSLKRVLSPIESLAMFRAQIGI